MNEHNYERIAKAIEFLRDNRYMQPDLATVAAAVSMSPFHFQRVFSEWAGVSPKHFLQYLNLKFAGRILRERGASLFDTACAAGLSGTGRLHDLFVSIEGMTPGEYRNGGENLVLNYGFSPTPFGEVIIASTAKGVCVLEFADDRREALDSLHRRFPRAKLQPQTDRFQRDALSIFSADWSRPEEIRLHLKGSDFQIKVWEALLNIPMGDVTSYGEIAAGIDRPKACRAVGTAVGDNPVALIIPCHRVIRATGEIGNYHWGTTRKKAILGWEAARTRPDLSLRD